MTVNKPQKPVLPSEILCDELNFAHRQHLALLEESAQCNARLLDTYHQREQRYCDQLQVRDDRLELSLEKERDLSQQLADTLQRIENLSRLFAKREKEHCEQVLLVQRSAENRLEELARTYAEQVQALLQQNLQQERSFGSQLSQVQEKAHAEVQLLLEQLATREHEQSRKLSELYTVAEQEKAEISKKYAERYRKLHKMYRQAEAEQAVRFHCSVEHVSAEISSVQATRWWRLGAFFGWLPKDGFRGVSELLSVANSYQKISDESILEKLFSVNEVVNSSLIHKKNAAFNSFLPPASSNHQQNEYNCDYGEVISMNALDSLENLLLLPESEFLKKAYQLILGRHIDPQGFKHYRKRLLCGVSRIEVLADLIASPEAKVAKGPEIEEVYRLIEKTGAGRKGWRKWWSSLKLINFRFSVLERSIQKQRIVSEENKPAKMDMSTVIGALIRVETKISNFERLLMPGHEREQAIVDFGATKGCVRLGIPGIDSELIAGELYRIAIELENHSSAHWETSHITPVYVSYHVWTNSGEMHVYDGLRTALSSPVAPGEKCQMEIEVQMPVNPGSYLIEIAMVHDGQYWFERRGFTSCFWPITVVLAHCDYPDREFKTYQAGEFRERLHWQRTPLESFYVSYAERK